MNRKDLERILRVDQAGEYGAVRIYAGQLAVLGCHKTIQEMADHEADHLRKFNQLLIEHKVRPTFFQPLWSIAAYGLGVISALGGEKMAHACTIAVETVIDDHYLEQQHQLDNEPQHAQIAQIVHECHQDELLHRQTAIEHGGQEAPYFQAVHTVVTAISKAAIWLSSRF